MTFDQQFEPVVETEPPPQWNRQVLVLLRARRPNSSEDVLIKRADHSGLTADKAHALFDALSAAALVAGGTPEKVLPQPVQRLVEAVQETLGFLDTVEWTDRTAEEQAADHQHELEQSLTVLAEGGTDQPEKVAQETAAIEIERVRCELDSVLSGEFVLLKPLRVELLHLDKMLREIKKGLGFPNADL